MNDGISDKIGLPPEIQAKILVSLVIIIVLWLIRFLILKLVWRLTEDARSRYLWKRYASFTVTILATILIGSVWIQAIRQFGAFLGLLGGSCDCTERPPYQHRRMAFHYRQEAFFRG